MPDLLLELFSEEIPARMQRQGAEDLRRLVTDGLVGAGLTYEGARAFATPRRLALTVHGLTARSADLREERKGPRVGAPEKAIEGFLRAAGLASIDQAQVHSDPKKGDFYVALIDKPGRAAEEIVAEVVREAIEKFPWPKSMRWGSRSTPPDSPFAAGPAEGTSSLRWVRPLRSILCTFGPETEDPVVVPIEVGGVAAGNVTMGHRFMGKGAIAVRRFDDYVSALEAAKVVLDPERRKAIIETEAKHLAFARGLEVVEDAGLLEEAAGLVEWPVVLMGAFDEDFLDIPDEVIRLTIRQNQKCFVLRRTEDRGQGTEEPGNLSSVLRSPSSALTNRFLLVANIEASDGGKAIVAGNERVIAARLSDARFFWEQDRKAPLEAWGEKLDGVTFHEKLGSQKERVERIARLARELAPLVGADPDDAERAARLAKADLTTAMVGEFPELQGVMGRYYFLAENGLWGTGDLGFGTGEDHSPTPSPPSPTSRLHAIADAIRDHYKPQGPNDSVPSEPVSIAVALADKLDTLVGFWAIDEKPTGSKDPYALRRAALGVIRIVLGGQLRVRLLEAFAFWIAARRDTEFANESYVGVTKDEIGLRFVTGGDEDAERPMRSWFAFDVTVPSRETLSVIEAASTGELLQMFVAVTDNVSSKYAHVSQRPVPVAFDLLSFFADRLKVHLRDTGARHDLIDAVFAAGAGGGSARPRSSPQRGEGGARSAPGEGAAKKEPPSPASGLRPSATSPRGGEEGRPSASAANDDLLMIVRRVEALGKFLDTDDGANLLVGYRRAANILRDEEKKDGAGAFDGPPDHHLIETRGEKEERALFHVMQAAEAHAREHVEREDFEGAMRALAELRPAVDAFFDHVTVNDDDPDLRVNRLRLLNMLRQATLAVADFSRIGG